jgi:formate C-acetyltransferase
VKVRGLCAGLPDTTASFVECGHHIQFNVVDVETLKKAQEKPEDFKSLIVRVAGYSAYFNELTKDVQDEIIQRTEQRID